MRYCKKCLQPDTRPGIYFNENQVCGACLYEESKQSIDWNARREELFEIADWAKREANKRSMPYHCVVGVSGGKDSTFQAIYLREKLGLNPLLVNCVPDSLTNIGRKNIENLASHGFDMVHIRPNPKIARLLAKKGLYEYGNLMRASEYCLWSSSFRVAYQFHIPLNILGENPALTLGTSLKMRDDSDAAGIFDSNTLDGGETGRWLDKGITESDLYLYRPPSKEEAIDNDLRAIYLQYFLKEWSQVGNADFAIARGLVGRATEDLHDLGRYRRFSSLDSDDVIVNQMIKYLKFGFGFATDEVCYDIREGRLQREAAAWYVQEYDGKCGSQYIEKVCAYLEIDEDEFWRVVDGFVNRELFKRGKEKERWIPRFNVGEDF